MAAEIGKTVRESREAAGITMTELAERTRIDVSYLSNLEAGRLDNPTLDTLLSLQSVLPQLFLRLAVPGAFRDDDTTK